MSLANPKPTNSIGVPIDPTVVVYLLAGATLVAFGLLGAATTSEFGAGISTENLISPMVVGGICGGLAVYLLRSRDSVWSPLPWFLVVCAVHYGLGPLVFVLGSADSVAYIDQYYYVDAYHLLRTNVLNALCLGVAVISAASIFTSTHWAAATQPAKARIDDRSCRIALAVFLLVGLPIKLFAVIPSWLGAEDQAIAGWVQTLSQMSLMAFTPALLLARGGQQNFRFLAYGLIAMELLISFASFSKLEVLKVILFVLINLYWLNGSVRRLAVLGIASFAFYYLFLSDFILFLRLEFSLGSNRSFWSFITGSSDFVSSGTSELADILPGVQSWWTRLANAAPQAFAMDSFDTGNSFDTLSSAFSAWLPRALFPEKPQLTIGDTFNIMVTGNPFSKSAPGIFAEGYWNAGWLGALGIAVYVGVLIGMLHRYCVTVIRARHIEFLPCVWLCISMALQPDSWFVAQYIGPIAILLVLHWLIKGLVAGALLSRRTGTF